MTTNNLLFTIRLKGMFLLGEELPISLRGPQSRICMADPY